MVVDYPVLVNCVGVLFVEGNYPEHGKFLYIANLGFNVLTQHTRLDAKSRFAISGYSLRIAARNFPNIRFGTAQGAPPPSIPILAVGSSGEVLSFESPVRGVDISCRDTAPT